MSKRIVLLSLLLLSFLSISGCWDRAELENLGLVQALGLDLDEQEKKITVTTMIAVPSKLGGTAEGGGSGEGPGVVLISMQADSIYEAFNLINTTLNREVTLLQNQVLILGENLAKFGVQRWIDNLIRFREMRRILLIYTCKGKAADILKVQPAIDPNPAEYFRDLTLLSKTSGMYPITTLHDFMRRYESYTQENYTPLIAPYEKKEETKAASTPDSGGDQQKEEKPKEIRIIGTSIFKGDKVVGSFDLYESQILQILTNKFNQAYQTIEDPGKKGYFIVYRLSSAKPVQINYVHKEVDCFNVKVQMEANIISIQSTIDYSRPDKEKVLSRRISAALKKRIQDVISKSQKKFKSDVFGFGAKVRNTMLTTTDWENYHWADKYPSSRINVDVKINIRRVGVQFQPPQPRE